MSGLKSYQITVNDRTYFTMAFDDNDAAYTALRQYMTIHDELPERVEVTEVSK